MPGELQEFLTEHGVESKLLDKAKSHGVSATAILSLLLKWGPEALQIIQDILNLLQPPTPPPPTATA